MGVDLSGSPQKIKIVLRLARYTEFGPIEQNPSVPWGAKAFVEARGACEGFSAKSRHRRKLSFGQ
jgi:hypothetical protein